jgi:hypothetical protein
MKIICEVCKNLGQLQHLSKNYYRVKHYLGSIDGKLKFEYHKQSFQYVQGILSENNISPIDLIDQKHIDLKIKDLSSVKVRGVGFEPTNPYGIAASGLRLWPCLATPAHVFSPFYFSNLQLKLNLALIRYKIKRR